jgi:hypothetical protein
VVVWPLVFSCFTWLKDVPEEVSYVRGAILHASVTFWRGVHLKLMRNSERDVLSRQTEAFMPRKARMICIEETAVVSPEPEK